MIPRVPSGTPSPRPASIERKVAEQRKKLEALGQKRLETAKKQEELDKQMAPYKQRLAEELERLNREMMEEEAAAAEDEEHLKASAEMYEEFKSAGGGD
jgi:predicted  nucleic acid-binding Zn-ribbon protein